MSNIDLALKAGLAAHQVGKLGEAARRYRMVLRDAPNNIDALHLLGVVAHESGDHLAACELIERAIALSPHQADMWVNYAAVRRSLCDQYGCVEALANALALNPAHVEARANMILTLDIMPAARPTDLLDARTQWARLHRVGHLPYRAPRIDYPLRVGYVGGDFRLHSAEMAFGPVIRNHTDQIIPYIYNAGPEDAVTTDYRALKYRHVKNVSAERLAEWVQHDEIDVLVDLSGHTQGNMLAAFAYRPAPVQVSAWGYCTGTGLPEMDYLLLDPSFLQLPAIRETIVPLPAALPWIFPPDVPAIAIRPDQRPITYGYLGDIRKLNADVLAVWGQLLRNLPDSIMVFKGAGFEQPYYQGWILSGLGLTNSPTKVEFIGPTPHAAHIAVYNRVDVVLDPWPHGGGVTTLEALTMGCPVVTMLTPTVAGTMTASLIRHVRAGGIVVSDIESYIAVANSAIPLTAQRRASIQTRLQHSPICDIPAYVGAVESHYLTFVKNATLGTARPRHRDTVIALPDRADQEHGNGD